MAISKVHVVSFPATPINTPLYWESRVDHMVDGQFYNGTRSNEGLFTVKFLITIPGPMIVLQK